MSSVQPKKQRKMLYKGSLHLIKKNTSSHLSKELRTRYKKRSAMVHTGDTVKIMRGKFKGKSGKVERVETRHNRVYVEGMQVQKANGQKSKVPLNASKLLITELNLSDKIRKEIFEGTKAKGGMKNE